MDLTGKWIEQAQAVVPAFQGQPAAVTVVRPGVQPGQLPTLTGTAEADPGLDADDAAGEADQDRGQGRGALQVRHLPVGGSRRPAEAVRPDSEADRPVDPGLCLGLRLAARTNGSASRRRASAIRPTGGLRGMSEGEASCAPGSGRDGGGTGGAFSGIIVATVPAGG